VCHLEGGGVDARRPKSVEAGTAVGAGALAYMDMPIICILWRRVDALVSVRSASFLDAGCDTR
jgi:hypothetical protein